MRHLRPERRGDGDTSYGRGQSRAFLACERGCTEPAAQFDGVRLVIERQFPIHFGPLEGREQMVEAPEATIVIAKQCNGLIDMFKLVYFNECTRFENLAVGSER